MARLDIEFSVISAEVSGNLLGRLCFVIAALMESDGERLDRTCALRLHEGNDCRGIDAAGKKRTERNVSDHAEPDGIAQQHVEPFDGLARVRLRIVAALAGD